MQIIDAQVHTYERNSPRRPWKGHLPGPDEVTGAQMVAAMDAAGIDAALATSPLFLYGYDPSYALEVAAEWPHRFAVVAPVDFTRPDIDDFVAQWAAHPHTVGLRIMTLSDEAVQSLDTTPARNFMRVMARSGLPLCMGCWGQLAAVAPVLRRHSDVQFVIDHLGLVQTLERPAPPEPFAQLPVLLELAECPNVAVKVTGSATLSHESYPFRDIWPALTRVFEAFGFERCMWGTDWTRAIAHLTLEQAVDAIRMIPGISPSDRELLMGGSVRRVFRWNPVPRAAADATPLHEEKQ